MKPKEIKSIHGESLMPYFKEKYAERAEEMYTLATLFANYFYYARKQYHRDDCSYLKVDKTFNRGMGRALLLSFRISLNEIWVNTAIANKIDYDRLSKMLDENNLHYFIVPKQYNILLGQWC